jgi:hypothetical protein
MSRRGLKEAWTAHDLTVVLVATLVFLGGAWLLRLSLATPLSTITFGDLTLERPGRWMPAVEVNTTGSAIAAFAPEPEPTPPSTSDAGPTSSEDAGPAPAVPVPKTKTRAQRLHVQYQSADDSSLRLELLSAPEAILGSWQQEVAFNRAARYGDLYSVTSSKIVNIRSRDWLLTEFRYAHKVNESPEIATASEYATSFGGHTVVVTVHGNDDVRDALERRMVPSLQLSGSGTK